VSGRRWVWTDLKWGKRKFEPIVGERSVPVETSREQLLRKASTDRSPMVRRVAGEFLIKDLDSMGEDAAHLAEKLACDPSSYVAERGRFAIESLRRSHV
jgi:hypothetical protein